MLSAAAAAEAEAERAAAVLVALLVVVCAVMLEEEVEEDEVVERRELVVARRRRAGTLNMLPPAAAAAAPEVVVEVVVVAEVKASLLAEEAVEELRLRVMRSTMAGAGLLRRGLRFSLLLDALELLCEDCGRASSSEEPASVAGMREDEGLKGSSRRLESDSRISPMLEGFLPVLVRRGLDTGAAWGWLLGMTAAGPALEACVFWLSAPGGGGGGAKMKSMSSSLPRSSIVRMNAWLRGFSATLLMRSSA
jgi:hypothetical protein